VGEVLSRDSLVLTSLRVFDVLDPCSRSSRDTYARSPTTPVYTLYLAYEDSSSSNVFVLTTHSYVYVAFLITTSFSALYPGSCLLRDRFKLKNKNELRVNLKYLAYYMLA